MLPTLLLDRSTVEALLEPDGMRQVLAEALIEFSAGRALAPARIAVALPGQGLLAAMPAFAAGFLACKLVTVFAKNHAGPVPSHQALIGLFDAADGSPLAVLDGTAITAARTGAVTALAVDRLAPPRARVLAVLGTGVQARSHLVAVPRVRRFAEIRVAGRDPARAAGLAAAFGGVAAPDLESAVRGADVVCACTNAPQPVLRHAWLAPSALVASVGIGGPELDAATLDAATRLAVETRQAFLPFPAGACELGGRDPAAAVELGELLSRPPAPPAPGLAVYKSVGLAVEDAAVAAWVLRRARAAGRGVPFDFSR